MIRVLILAALAASLATSASADPISAAFTAFNAWIGGLSATALFAVRIGFSLALSALATALQGKPDAPRRGGIKTEATTTGGTQPQSFILGRYATAGHMAAPPYSHPNSGAVPNEFLTYVVDISDLPGVTFSRAIVAGEYVAGLQASAGDHDLEGMLEDVPGVGVDVPHFFLTWHDGSQVAADAYMLANYGTHPDRPWTADMIGTGLTYAVVTFRYNRKLFNQLPGVRFEVDGVPLYDPRLDGSVGGTGAQRWNDPATWAQTDNPAVMIYNILRGIALPGGLVWGGRAAEDDLPLDVWFAAMNKCDEAVSLKAGGTEPRYRAGLEVAVDQSPAEVIEDLLKACSGEIAEIGGVYKIRIGGPGLPVYFLTDADIVADADQSLIPYPGLDGVHNAIHATHPAPAALWESRDAPPLYNATYEAEDGGRQLVASVDLPAVYSDTQVQRLMRAWVKDERRFRRHGLTLPPDAAVIEPLDAISWTSAEEGYSAKVFEVAEASDDLATCLQSLSIRERDGGDFNWTPASDEIDVSHPSTVVTVPAPRVVPGFLVEAGSIRDGANGARRPGIKLSWTASGVRERDAIRWQVRIENVQTVAEGVIDDPTSGFLWIGEGILPNTTYQARAKMRAREGSTWSAWQTVTTGDFRLGEYDLSDEVNQTVVDFAALTAGFSGTLTDLEVDAAAAQQAALDAAAEALASEAAKTAAQLARDQAQASATSASGSATAAAGSASAASASETAAGSSASAASASSITAEARAALTYPADFRDGGAYFTRAAAGGLAPVALSASDLATVTGIGPVFQRAGFSTLSPVAPIPAIEGAVYEFEAVVRVIANNTVSGANEEARLDLARLDEAGALHSFAGLTPRTGDAVSEAALNVSDGWVTLRGFYLVPASPTFALMRPRVYYGSGSPASDGVWQCRSFAVREITSEIAAEGFANASATSATAAEASNTAAGQSATAADTSRQDAQTAAANASASETNAATSETNAAGSEASAIQARDLAVAARDTASGHASSASASASSAASSASSAAGSASTATTQANLAASARGDAEAAQAAAEIAESAAVSAKTDAESASAAAAVSRDVAASIIGGGQVSNPIFLEPAASPTANPSGGFGLVDGSGSTIARAATGNKYDNGPCIEYDTGATLSASLPYIIHNATAQGGLSASDVVAVEIDFEVEMISGQWGSACIIVNWWGSTYSTQTLYLADAIPSRNGKKQRVSAILERPESFVAGGSDELRVIFYGNRNGDAKGETDHNARIHRFDYKVVSATASALLSQQAVADLEGNALASFVMRAKAGAALGSVEIIAATDAANGGASASKVTLTGDEIELAGDVTVFSGNEIKSSNFSEGSSGWRIRNGGAAEFNKIIDRSDLKDNAVSQGGSAVDLTNQILGTDTSQVALTYTIGEALTPDAAWTCGFVVELRGRTASGLISAFRAQYRTKTSGVWSAWQNWSNGPDYASDTWAEFSFVGQFIGNYEDFAIRIVNLASGTVANWSGTNNTRNAYLSARSEPAV